MQVYGFLEKAQLENVSVDLSNTLFGLVFYNTTDNKFKFYDGAIRSVVSEDGNATLTNKTFSGGTVTGAAILGGSLTGIDINLGVASDTNKIVVSANTTANLEALTREAGSIYFSTDEEKYYGDDGTQLVDLGGGGLGDADTYELETFEDFKIADIESTGQNATYKLAGPFGGTLSLETANPISGEVNLRYTAGVSSTGDWVNIKNVPVKRREKAVTNAREIWIDASNYSQNFDLIMYNISDGQVIEEARQTVIGGTSLKKYAAPFDLVGTANEISYGIHFNVAPVNGEFIDIDQVRLSVDPFAYVNINTQENEFAAIIQNNGAASLISEGAEFIDSVTRVGVGVVTINFKPGFFTEIPSVTATGLQNTGVAPILASVASSPALTANEVTIEIVNTNTGTFVDRDIFLNVSRQGTDYKSVTENVATIAKSGIETARFDTHAGYGSVANKIPYFTNERINNISNLGTVSNDSTNGFSVTVAKKVLAFVSYFPSFDTANNFGITKNASSVTNGIISIPIEEKIAANTQSAPSYVGAATAVVELNPGDIIRPHVDIAYGTSANGNIFEVVLVDFDQKLLSLIPVQKTAYLKDVKPSGTAGGTATAGSYLTRDLTSVEGNSEIVSLSANQFTLQAGTYEIEAISPFASSNGQRTNPSRIRLQNITDAVTEIYGQATNESYTTNSNGMGHSTIHGQITLDTPKTFEIQYRVTSSYGTNGLGFACNFGEDEVYTVVKITKVK